MAFSWRADDGPLTVVFESYLPSSTKTERKKEEKNVVRVGLLVTDLSESAHVPKIKHVHINGMFPSSYILSGYALLAIIIGY